MSIDCMRSGHDLFRMNISCMATHHEDYTTTPPSATWRPSTLGFLDIQGNRVHPRSFLEAITIVLLPLAAGVV